MVPLPHRHHLLVLLQGGEPRLQLLHGLRVIGADTAGADAADFIKQALDVVPLFQVAVSGRILLLFLADREVTAAGDQDGGAAGLDGVTGVHVLGQLAAVGLQQTVDFLMVHGVHALLLALGQLGSRVHHTAVLGGCASGLVVPEAVHVVGAAGGLFVDGMVAHFFAAPFLVFTMQIMASERHIS